MAVDLHTGNTALWPTRHGRDTPQLLSGAMCSASMRLVAHCMVPLRLKGRLPLRLRGLRRPPCVLSRRRSNLHSNGASFRALLRTKRRVSFADLVATSVRAQEKPRHTTKMDIIWRPS